MTRLGDKIDVAPLEPARLARVEEQVVAGLERVRESAPRPARRPAVAVAAAGACVALAVAGHLGWRAGRGSGGGPVPAIATGPGERARLEVAGAVVQVGEASRVTLRGDGGAVVLDLARGRVDCDVEARGDRAGFVVQAGDVAVEVVGTVFSVERDHEVKVRVARGTVRVVAASAAVAVGAGQSWASSRGVTSVATLDPSPSQTPNASPSETPNASSSPTVIPSPTAIPIPEPSSVPGPDPIPIPSPTASPDPEPHPSKPSGSTLSPRPESETALPADLPPLSPRCHTVATCLTIALEETGAEAGRALYTLVHLELRANDPAGAVTHAELYERRFARRRPAEAEAVLWLRILAHREAGETDRSRAAARTYLERHPRGRHAEEARSFVYE